VADDEVNYRRFFDVNALAGVRVEQPEVFSATHNFVLSLIRQGKLDGLRIDHPDGLYDPLEYYERLQAQAADGEPVYIVVEKILANHERLREEWPVQGTTGYEFTNLVNGVFVYADAERSLSRLYERFIGQSTSFEEILYERKKLVMRMMLAGQLAVLANLLDQISEKDRRTRDFTLHELRNSLAEIVAWFPVYRTYVRPGQVTAEDRRYVEWAVAQAQKRAFIIDRSIFDYLRRCLLLESIDERPPDSQQAIAHFAMKFQQYTAPVMAKGMEDTAFYSYNRLISLNEVGGDPARFGVSLAAFHHANQERARRWPHTLLSTSTHDTKRSEDVRARLNVLSELAAEWKLHVGRWSRINRARKRKIDGQVSPSRNDEYLLYQTLIGAWPLEDVDDEALARFADRVDAYMLKAMREAKVRTSWRNPNAEYEAAVSNFVHTLLANRASNLFLGDFIPFQQRVARYGMLNSVSQTVFKLTVPGVPDLYQGNEIWDFSLVDPDNRRPVDYQRRRALLTEIKTLFAGPVDTWARAAHALLDRQADGCTKLYVTWRLLGLRRDYPHLFRHGRYLPLTVHGPRADHLCAYARLDDEQVAIIVAPRWFARLEPAEALPLGDDVWGDSSVDVSPLPARDYRNVLTGETLSAEERDGVRLLPVRRVLLSFPTAVLMSG
jgi:(1->4)-alpha-D-glucan 1-alpha-D-glucosylmutase